MSDFGNYRRDLAVLDPAGSRIPQQQSSNAAPNAASNQVAPWMSSSNGPDNTVMTPSSTFGTTFFNDSSDNLSQVSQLSPGFRPGAQFPGHVTDSPADAYFGDRDERRPSLASVNTASSAGSKSSRAGGIHKKLQTFFGEDYPGKDGSDSSLPSHAKDSRSHSFARSQRGRNASNATDQTQREASPAQSRPRTPVPSSDVVPFLYQDSQVSLLFHYSKGFYHDVGLGRQAERCTGYQQVRGSSSSPRSIWT